MDISPGVSGVAGDGAAVYIAVGGVDGELSVCGGFDDNAAVFGGVECGGSVAVAGVSQLGAVADAVDAGEDFGD